MENGSGCLGPIFISLPTSLHMQKFGEFVKSNANSSCELCSSGIRAVSCFSPGDIRLSRVTREQRAARPRDARNEGEV